MGVVSTPPTEAARSIFTDLGYTVSGSGREFSAERKWRVVAVTAADESTELPKSGDLRCFVAREVVCGVLPSDETPEIARLG